MTLFDEIEAAGTYLTGQKTLWEKEKFLMKNSFSFPTVFSKDLHSRHMKTRACLGNGLLRLLL